MREFNYDFFKSGGSEDKWPWDNPFFVRSKCFDNCTKVQKKIVKLLIYTKRIDFFLAKSYNVECIGLNRQYKAGG